jgi:hypothetical protein
VGIGKKNNNWVLGKVGVGKGGFLWERIGINLYCNFVLIR